MLKPDIIDRINAINTRLNEMVTTAESESRHLTDEENSEKSALLEERLQHLHTREYQGSNVL